MEEGGGRPSRDQASHWSEVYTANPAFFGDGASGFARVALERFRQEGVHNLLELGSGQGRDTFFFAENGLTVSALDYSEAAVAEISAKARKVEPSSAVVAQLHDLRKPLPFPDASFDACFSHMLLCMELRTEEIAFVLSEVRRVLRPVGLHLFSVRSTFDKHYQMGVHLTEDLYDVGGFVVHFLGEEKIRRLAAGYDVVDLARMEEGSLPRDLFVVTLRKSAAEAVRPEPGVDKCTVVDPMTKFQEFLDATYHNGTLDRKTKHLVALGASIAVGCDTSADDNLAAARAAGATDAELREVCSVAMTVGASKTKLFFEKVSGVSEASAPRNQMSPSAPAHPSGIT